ncbi:hypothetical protein [Halarcobacter sp.]|nr:hypothetical protein [Halarcobacter sp.]
MDRILVTFLIIIVSMIALLGIIEWSSLQENNLKNDAASTVSSTVNTIK